jgi:hypothetical protein
MPAFAGMTALGTFSRSGLFCHVKENERRLKNVETKTRGPLSSWPLDPDAPTTLLEKTHHFFRQITRDGNQHQVAAGAGIPLGITSRNSKLNIPMSQALQPSAISTCPLNCQKFEIEHSHESGTPAIRNKYLSP